MFPNDKGKCIIQDLTPYQRNVRRKLAQVPCDTESRCGILNHGTLLSKLPHYKSAYTLQISFGSL